jgi:hypothetical protein
MVDRYQVDWRGYHFLVSARTFDFTSAFRRRKTAFFSWPLAALLQAAYGIYDTDLKLINLLMLAPSTPVCSSGVSNGIFGKGDIGISLFRKGVLSRASPG